MQSKINLTVVSSILVVNLRRNFIKIMKKFLSYKKCTFYMNQSDSAKQIYKIIAPLKKKNVD